MGYVDEAFAKAKAALEITATERKDAARRHGDIRAVVGEQWTLDDDFLTGSYRRDTKTKRLKDVDIFVVVDPAGEQAPLRQQHPSQILSGLKAVLDSKYDSSKSTGSPASLNSAPTRRSPPSTSSRPSSAPAVAMRSPTPNEDGGSRPTRRHTTKRARPRTRSATASTCRS